MTTRCRKNSGKVAIKYLCQGCVSLLDGYRSSVCPDCAREFNRLLNLYNRIVSAHPKLRDRGPAEVFEFMYETIVRKKESSNER